MQQGDFINLFLARHVSGTYAHHQEHYMLSCSIWFSAPSFWMGGGLESRCVGRVCSADFALHGSLNEIILFHQVGISDYFMRKMNGQTTLINQSKFYSKYSAEQTDW